MVVKTLIEKYDVMIVFTIYVYGCYHNMKYASHNQVFSLHESMIYFCDFPILKPILEVLYELLLDS